MGLAERESKRKQSLVGAMISDSDASDTFDSVSTKSAKTAKVIAQDMIVPKAKAETRSKRINLLIRPSVYAQSQKKCEEMGISLNECVNQFLESWTQV